MVRIAEKQHLVDQAEQRRQHEELFASCMSELCFFLLVSTYHGGMKSPHLFVNVKVDGSKAFIRNIRSLAATLHNHFRIEPRKDGKLHITPIVHIHVSVHKNLLIAQRRSVHLNSTVIQLHLTIGHPRPTVTLIGSFFEHSIRSSRPAGIL